ncbi:MAG: hypothetical protein CUN56_13270 [Phototrophicales bacterium]|nr:MAG: hypothetical protein CUN56_13270 [Phototrophicales bacterium]
MRVFENMMDDHTDQQNQPEPAVDWTKIAMQWVNMQQERNEYLADLLDKHYAMLDTYIPAHWESVRKLADQIRDPKKCTVITLARARVTLKRAVSADREFARRLMVELPY